MFGECAQEWNTQLHNLFPSYVVSFWIIKQNGMNIPEEPHYWYISLLLLCYCVPPPTQCILNMTWHTCCMIKPKQLDEHLFYILFCPSARKPNFSSIVTPYQHQYCILLMWCFYYWFLDVFVFCDMFNCLDNIVLNPSLWLCLLCMLVPLEKLCVMAGF